MLKLVGLLLVFGVCVSAGFGKAKELEDAARTLRDSILFLKQFSILLEGRQLPPGQIVKIIGGQAAFAQYRLVHLLQGYFDTSESFERNLRLAVNECPQLALCGGGEILLGLGDMIGSRSLEEQLSAIASATQLLEQALADAETRRSNQGILYRRMGFLGGLMAVVLFL